MTAKTCIGLPRILWNSGDYRIVQTHEGRSVLEQQTTDAMNQSTWVRCVEEIPGKATEALADLRATINGTKMLGPLRGIRIYVPVETTDDDCATIVHLLGGKK